MIRWVLPACVALWLSQPAVASAGDAYYQLHYDYEAAAQCGLVSPAVEAAFRKKRRAADAASALPVEQRRQLRLKAYVAVEREYDNRGLGGHKQWCRGAVSEGVGRIVSPAE